MKVITVVNNVKDYFFNLLKLSCALNKLELIGLVVNGHFSGMRLKDEVLHYFLQEVPDDEIILFTDGFDVVFTAGENEILAKFEQKQKQVIFSGELGCYPDTKLSRYYPDDTRPFKYLNSGGFIGQAGAIKELLLDNEFDHENFEYSNQYIWAKRFLKYPGKIGVDSNSEIFCTFYTPEFAAIEPSRIDDDAYCMSYYHRMKEWFNKNFLIENDRIFNKLTSSRPCHLHFNGKSRLLFDDEIIQMVYNKIPGNKPALFYEAN